MAVSTRALILALFFAALLPPRNGGEAGEPVDLELALAVDVSGSMDGHEALVQRRGYAAAFRDPAVIGAIGSGVRGRIAVTYFEWSGAEAKNLIADWTVIDGPATAIAFAGRLERAAIATGTRTSLSGAIDFAIPRFSANRFDGTRRVIDISGNGENNYGRLVTEARDAAIAAGITVNGLPMVIDRPNGVQWPRMPDFGDYFRDCVIGGGGAFMIVARGYEDLAAAVRRKLVIEIAGLIPPAREFTAVSHPWRLAAATAPCDIGERRFRWLMERAYPR